MKTAIARLISASTYGQSRYYKTPKHEKESSADYEARTWRDRLHINEDGNVFIPPMQFKKCIDNAAQYLSMKIPGKGNSTYTKHVRSGIMVFDSLVLPIKKEEVNGLWLLVPSDGKSGGGKRVEKCFPIIDQWGGDVVFHVFDETVSKDVFKYILEEAGKFIGLGFFRPERGGYYGRFGVEKITWK